MHDKLLAFVPCFNCAPQIGRVLAQLTGQTGELFDEVLVLDNGSSDGTLDAAVAAASGVSAGRVTVARNRGNYHLGGSHKAAFAHAAANGFSHVAVLHGDDQADLADLLPVLRAGLHRRAEACLGSRFASGARLDGYSRLRTAGNIAFNALFSLACRRVVTDLGSGLNIFARSVFADPAVARFPDDLRFNVHLLLHLCDARVGRDAVFFPISWREDDQISNVRLLEHGRRVLGILISHLADPASFAAAEHRAAPRAAYPFDVAWSSK